MALLHAAEELLGAHRCEWCARPGAVLCPRCAGTLAAPSPGALPGITRVVAAWPYETGARALVLALKVRGARAAAEPLVDAMHAAALRVGVSAEVVAWVPGRARDVRRRGFDHAEVLARGVALRLGFPPHPLLRRVAEGRDQAGLGAPERRANARGAFAARTAEGSAVLVVDDLVTTGSTLGACARALRDAGAATVEALVACRA